MLCDKKVIIWDLDNTLYRITPDIADSLDETMALALIEDLDVPLSFDECKDLVKKSYKEYLPELQKKYKKEKRKKRFLRFLHLFR